MNALSVNRGITALKRISGMTLIGLSLRSTANSAKRILFTRKVNRAVRRI